MSLSGRTQAHPARRERKIAKRARGAPPRLPRHILGAFIAQSTHIDVVQEMLSGTKQDGSDGEMQLVNQAGAQKLPNGGYATTQADVATARCGSRLFHSGMNAFGDKAKLRASRHPKRRPRVMRQHEDGRVIWRLIAPPPLPALVRPRASDRTEHVAPKNPSTNSGKALLRDSVIDSRLSIIRAVHPPPYVRVEEPLHQFRAPDAERILETLVGSSTVTVDGNREAFDTEFRHYFPLCFGRGGARGGAHLRVNLGAREEAPKGAGGAHSPSPGGAKPQA